MKPLPMEFPKNGLSYRIIERSATRYFAELTSESGAIVGYETARIIKRPARDAIMGGKPVHFDACEVIPTDNDFGHDPFDCCVLAINKEMAHRKFLDGTNHDKKGFASPKNGQRAAPKSESGTLIPL